MRSRLDALGHGARRSRLDRVGVALVVAGVAWTAVTAAANPGSRPLPTLAALAVVGLATWAGRALRRRFDRGVESDAPCAVAVNAGVLVGLAVGIEPWAPGSAPLGYANANGTLFGLLVLVPAMVLATTTPAHTVRRLGLVLGAVAFLFCVLAGSVGASLSTAAGVAVVVAGLWRGTTTAVALAAACLAVALAGTGALALGLGPDEPGADAGGVRIALWREAVDLGQDRPIVGVGPGRYQAAQRVSADPDLRRAHSAPLQQLAEQGLPGFALLLGLAAWALVALRRAAPHPAAAVGAGVVAAVGTEATIDWVLAEPVIIMLAALLVGVATQRVAPGRSRRA